ncbi:MAG TPA: SAM-dependent methyltransferase [Pseudonocardiaceae bacterium]|nr:SAM-dependent methyltransferase [Pseudonocardiaceae bacterium]
MESSSELPPLVDTSRPNPARIYDYLLGGSHNFAVDRETAEQTMAAGLVTAAPAIANRSFLRRAVRFMIEEGIDQFLDLGSGIPTVGNVHEIAQQAHADARVVYVDNEPIAVAHARQLLADDPNTAMVAADLRDADTVLNHPDTRALLDFRRPIGLLMVAVFHFVPDGDDPAGIVARYASAVADGSYVAISHYTRDGYDEAKSERVRKAMQTYQRTATPVYARSATQLGELVNGLEIVPPGIVWTPLWRPDSSEPALCEPSDAEIIAAVARITH